MLNCFLLKIRDWGQAHRLTPTFIIEPKKQKHPVFQGALFTIHTEVNQKPLLLFLRAASDFCFRLRLGLT